jgi:hypothetical protein
VLFGSASFYPFDLHLRPSSSPPYPSGVSVRPQDPCLLPLSPEKTWHSMRSARARPRVGDDTCQNESLIDACIITTPRVCSFFLFSASFCGPSAMSVQGPFKSPEHVETLLHTTHQCGGLILPSAYPSRPFSSYEYASRSSMVSIDEEG